MDEKPEYEEKPRSINPLNSVKWGGLTKKMLAGSALVAGLSLVFCGDLTGLVDVAKNLATSIGAAFTAEGGKVAIPESIKWLAIKIGGIALAVTGYKHLISHTPEKRHYNPEAEETHTMKLDMQRMDALMKMRMQAQGYAPAMALANQPGRG